MYKLVIADDELIISNGLRKFIDWNLFGFELVGVFQDGYDVIEYIKQNPVDVVLSDVVMCNVSGIDVSKYIKENKLDITVVLLSGYRDFEYARQAIKYGCNNYLLKPVSKEELENTFSELYIELNNKYKTEVSLPAEHDTDKIIHDNYFDLISIILEKMWTEEGDNKRLWNVSKNLFSLPSEKLMLLRCLSLSNSFSTKWLYDRRKQLESKQIYASIIEAKTINMLCSCEGLNYHRSAKQCISFINDENYKLAFVRLKKIEFSDDQTKTNVTKEHFLQIIDRVICILEKIDSGTNNIPSVSFDFEITQELSLKDFELLCMLAFEVYIRRLCASNQININNLYSIVDPMTDYADAARWLNDVYNCAVVSLNGDKDEGYDFVIAKIINYIKENISEDVSIKKLSSIVHMNSAYFGRYFKKHTLYTVNQYITKLRMEHAIHLMYEKKSLSEIAQSVGYENKYFFSIFKSYTGYSPREFILYFVE